MPIFRTPAGKRVAWLFRTVVGWRRPFAPTLPGSTARIFVARAQLRAVELLAEVRAYVAPGVPSRRCVAAGETRVFVAPPVARSRDAED